MPVPQTLCRAAVALSCLCAATASQAAQTLIGETLDFLRAYPSISTQFGAAIPGTTVAAGPSDAVNWSNQVFIDPEADRITFSIPSQTGFIGTTSTFDGFVVSGFDHDIAAVTVLGNTTNFVLSLSNDLRSFAVNVGTGSTLYSSGDFAIGVTLVGAPVPEPATALLLAGGLAVLLRLRPTSRPSA